MKYMDIGLSAAIRHIKSNPLFNTAISLGYDEFIEQFENEQSVRKQLLAKASIDLLQELTDDSFGIKRYIPRELYSRGRSGIRPIEDDFPIFKKTVDLCQRLIELNRTNYSRWLSAAEDCVASLDYDTKQVLLSCIKTGGWVLGIKRQEENTILDFGKMLWGRVSLILKGCQTDCNTESAVVCFAEAERCDEKICLRLLCTDLSNPILSPDAVISQMRKADKSKADNTPATFELEFICGEMTSEVRLFSYGKHYRQRGDSYAEQLVSGSNCLFEKYKLLGASMLTGDERRLLAAARLTCLARAVYLGNRFVFKPFDRFKLFEMLDNRFETERLCDELEEKYKFPEMAKALRQTLEAYTEDAKKAQKKFAKVIEYYQAMLSGSAGYFFKQRFCRQLYNLCSDYEPNDMMAENIELTKKVFSCADELLNKNGFSGDFPHYSKIADDRLDFISFVRKDYIINSQPVSAYSMNIASVGKKEFRAASLNEDEAIFNDISALPKSSARCGQIMNASDDCMLMLSKAFAADEDSYVELRTARLMPCVNAALDALSSKALDKNYIAHRKRAYEKSAVGKKDGRISAIVGIATAFLVGLLMLWLGYDTQSLEFLAAPASGGAVFLALKLFFRRKINRII